MKIRVKDLSKYDSNLTVADVIKCIEDEEKLLEKKVKKEVEDIKSKFENKYFKYTDNEGYFGKSLNVVHFKDFDRRDLNESFKPVYVITGSIICFCERELFIRDIRAGWCDKFFSAEDLQQLIEITEKEYNEYLNEYNRITGELKELIK